MKLEFKVALVFLVLIIQLNSIDSKRRDKRVYGISKYLYFKFF